MLGSRGTLKVQGCPPGSQLFELPTELRRRNKPRTVSIQKPLLLGRHALRIPLNPLGGSHARLRFIHFGTIQTTQWLQDHVRVRHDASDSLLDHVTQLRFRNARDLFAPCVTPVEEPAMARVAHIARSAAATPYQPFEQIGVLFIPLRERIVASELLLHALP